MAEKPSGCFEQTSSSVAPQVEGYSVNKKIIEQKELLGQEVTPAERALLAEFKANIQHGYLRMIRYEVPTGGYEWFG